MIFGAHQEYVTHAQYDAAGVYLDQGGRMMHLGGNGWYWSVGRHPAAEGPIEYRKNTLWSERVMQDGLRGGGFWETDRRLESLFGVTMSGMTVSACTDFRKLPDAENPWDSWIFDGCTGGENFGSYGVDKNQGAPPTRVDRGNLQCHSRPDRGNHNGTIAFNMSLSPPGERESITRSDIVFSETANGGAVFSSSSIAWNNSLWENDGSNDVAQITGNIIRRLPGPTPFPPLPGNGDWRKLDMLSGDLYSQNLLKNDGQSASRQRMNSGGVSDHAALIASPHRRHCWRLVFTRRRSSTRAV